MFSSTTIASSMTMPTISVSASIVIWLSVKSQRGEQRERRDDGHRNRERRDDRRPEIPQEQEHDDRGEQAAENQMLFDAQPS